MLINTISDIKKIILEIVLFFITLLILFYLLLLHGVAIDKIDLFGTKIEKLYLKLDKKLILNLRSIKLNGHKQHENLLKDLQYINYIPYLFQEIKIDQIQIDKTKIKATYKENFFTLDSPQLFAEIAFYFQDHSLYALIKNLTLKRYNLSLKGVAKIQRKRTFFQGDYRVGDITGKIQLSKVKNKVGFYANSNFFDNHALAKAMQPLKLHPDIKRWSYERVRAKKYKLLYIKGRIDLKRFDPKKIQTLAIAKDVKVAFSKDLPPVKIDKVTLAYKNDNLYFKLFQPMYLDKNLDGSSVIIHSLFHNSSLDIHIKTKTPFDQKIRQILHKYGIDLNLVQKRGIVDANLLIKIILKNPKTTLQGVFKAKNSLFLLASTPIEAKKLTLKLQDNTLIFKNSSLSIPPYLQANVNGYIDLNRLVGKLFLKPLHVDVRIGQQDILQIPGIEEIMKIDLNNGLLRLVKLNTTYNINTKRLSIEHLQEIKSHSKILQKIEPLEAKANIDLQNKKIDLYLQSLKLPFYRTKKKINSYHITFDMIHKSGKINDFAIFRLKPQVAISLQNIMIDLKPLLDLNSSKSTQTFIVDLHNVVLMYKKHSLKIDQGSLKVGEKTINFTADVGYGHISLTKDLHLRCIGKNLDANTINALLAKKIFYEGRYDFSIRSDDNGLLQGSLKIKNGYMKDLKLVNNFFAFLNTIPALVSLSDPGYSSTGLPILDGKIDFLVAKNRIIFTNINLLSHSMQIRGKGYLDTKSDSIKLKLEIETLKGISTIIKNIPLAGYILLGKDGKITTAVEVYGKASDPHYRSLLPSETIQMPFHIIKRTLELPFKLFK